MIAEIFAIAFVATLVVGFLFCAGMAVGLGLASNKICEGIDE